MWIAQITNVTKDGVFGVSDGREHRIDVSKLEGKPQRGKYVEGYLAGGAIVAEKYATNLTIKQQLLSIGISEEEMDTRYSDLYVVKNDISTEWVNNYEFKQNVKMIPRNNGKDWYEIPFGYMDEYMQNKRK